MRLRLLLLAFLGALVPMSSASAAEPDGSRYFFILFGGQSVPFRARTAHTWAVYAKTTPVAGGTMSVESFAISWLPADGNVEPLKLRTVPGRNFTLEETLKIAESHNGHLSVWGPYEIDAPRYAYAEEQRRILESGVPRYRALDSFNLDPNIVNCVHGVTHASPNARHYVQPVIRVGEPGTSRLAKLYMNHNAWPGYPEKHTWLLSALKIDAYPNLTLREPGEYIPRRLR